MNVLAPYDHSMYTLCILMTVSTQSCDIHHKQNTSAHIFSSKVTSTQIFFQVALTMQIKEEMHYKVSQICQRGRMFVSILG